MAGNRACVPFLIAWLVRPPDFFSGQFQKLVSERVNLIPRKIAVLERRTYYIITVGRSAIIALNIASERSIVDKLAGSTRRIGRSRAIKRHRCRQCNAMLVKLDNAAPINPENRKK